MDIKQLLEKMKEFAGEKVGQKPGEQWKGTDKGTPGKKLVGASESLLKDLSKGPTAKTKEQELAEEWANFNEEDLGTYPKRPGRASDRHARGHEPKPRYKTIKADEGLEGDDSVEARWMVKVSDDEGDHLKTYHRKFPNLSAAKKAYKNTPYATDFKYKPVKKDQVEEAVGQDSFNRAGYNPISDESDYLKKLSDLSNLSRKPGLDQQMKDQIKQRILDLNAEARKKGYIQAESRGHNVIATKLKNLERERKFASGELKIPTPQERQAQLAKQQPKKEKVDEYGADNPAQATTQNASPAQAQQVAANLNTQKTALSQLKQINPEIDPQKAAMAVTKDVATMSSQEKEELAQVAKTLSPALGTPALGSIKTAIQKSQLQAKK